MGVDRRGRGALQAGRTAARGSWRSGGRLPPGHPCPAPAAPRSAPRSPLAAGSPGLPPAVFRGHRSLQLRRLCPTPVSSGARLERRGIPRGPCQLWPRSIVCCSLLRACGRKDPGGVASFSTCWLLGAGSVGMQAQSRAGAWGSSGCILRISRVDGEGPSRQGGTGCLMGKWADLSLQPVEGRGKAEQHIES